MTCCRAAFTLIELLVVVTIIVILLALLTPALDKAIEQAELVQCAANIKGGVDGGLQYGFSHRRAYPLRGSGGHMPNFVRQQNDYDLIKLLQPYVGIGVFQDPFTGEIDLNEQANDPITQLVANNCWYYDWGGPNWRMQRKMRKIGDRMVYSMFDETEVHTSAVLVSDFDMYSVPDRQYYAGHPDKDGRLYVRQHQNSNNPYFFNLPVQKVTLHWWESTDPAPNPARSAVTSNYGFDDGSVHRFNDVEVNDERMARVQDAPNLNPYTRGQHLPRN